MNNLNNINTILNNSERIFWSSKSAIYHGRWNNRNVAIKHIPRRFCVMDNNNRSIEATTLQMLQRYDHIIQYIDTVYEENDIYIVMEWFQGNTLKDYIQIRTRPISEKKVKNIIYQVAGVLNNCNKENLIYGDTKPDNIMIDAIGNIKMIDFGCTRPIHSVKDCYIGSPTYFSPEMFDKVFIPEYDVWGLGVLTYYIACRTHPFITYSYEHRNLEGIKTSILKTPLIFQHPIWEDWSDTGKKLIEEMLDKDPFKRPSISYVYNHRWFESIDITRD